MVFDSTLASRWWLLTMLIFAVTACLGTTPSSAAAPEKFWVFVGTYTGRTQSKGIYRMELDTATGKLSEPTLAAELDNPSFLAVHPTHKYLFAVNESDGKGSGAVTSFALDPKTGELTRLNQQSTVGDGPCHLVVDATGKNVLVANYGGGSVAVLPIGPDGKLGSASEFVQHTGKVFDARRQGSPHAHSINLDKANRFAVVADLGLDRVFVYKFDPIHGKLAPNDPPATKLKDRSGPRHFAFHPDGKHAYVINEIDCTVTAFDYDPDHGTLTEIQTVPTMPIAVCATALDRRGCGPPIGAIPLRLQPRSRQPGRLLDRPRDRPLDARRVPADSRQDPAQFRSGSDRLVCAGREYVLEHDRRFPCYPKTGALEPTGQVVEVRSPCCVKYVPIPN